MTRSYAALKSFALSFSVLALAACSAAGDDDTQGDDADQAFSSNLATLVDFEFDGELVTDSTWGVRDKIDDQFLYTIGHLNANRSVGRLDNLVVTNVKTTSLGGGQTKVTYHARLPVAWGSKSNIPSTYAFTLPKNVSYSGLESFTSKYKASCVDWGAHDVDSGSMWYYYRPKKSGCALDASDVVSMTATITTAANNTSGKYPEYQKVWEDDVLEVVSIFGKYEDGATANDAGIDAYNEFVGSVRGALSGATTVPASVAQNPGVATPDVTFKATLPDGKKVVVTALLVDNVRTAGAAFDARYAQLSKTADVIMYNGHAGLGQNVQALARKGQFLSNRYLLLFMNGCDTFAYVDGYLAQSRAQLNPSDPTGTKFMDIVTNAMPAYFASDSEASMALVRGLMSTDKPQTFEQMFKNIDSSQVVLVTGEEDNAFTPGMKIGSGGGGSTEPTPVLDVSGTVAKNGTRRFKAANLEAGSYTFELTGSGDADLYLRAGLSPTTTSYDCRSNGVGTSKETCQLDVPAGATLYVGVRGRATSSSFRLVARKD